MCAGDLSASAASIYARASLRLKDSCTSGSIARFDIGGERCTVATSIDAHVLISGSAWPRLVSDRYVEGFPSEQWKASLERPGIHD